MWRSIRQENLWSLNSIGPELITVSRWQTNGHCKCLHSQLRVGQSPTETLHKDVADLRLHFQLLARALWPSCTSWPTWSIRGRFWDCRQRFYGSCPEQSGNFQVSLHGTIETTKKCHFGVRRFEILGNTTSSEVISAQTQKIRNFPNKQTLPKPINASKRYLGFVNFYKKYIPRMAEKIISRGAESRNANEDRNRTLRKKRKPLSQ